MCCAVTLTEANLAVHYDLFGQHGYLLAQCISCLDIAAIFFTDIRIKHIILRVFLILGIDVSAISTSGGHIFVVFLFLFFAAYCTQVLVLVLIQPNLRAERQRTCDESAKQ